MLIQPKIDQIISIALEEDINYIDLSSDLTFDSSHTSRAKIVAKQAGVICGAEVATRVFSLLSSSSSASILKPDGSAVEKGETVLEVVAPTRELLKGERIALNFLGHLSGIATKTARMVALAKAANPSVTVCDTRKTTPTLRALEKYAVLCGGGRNHRFNLSDAAKLKDTHIDAFGGILPAAAKLRERLGHMAKLEVEAQSLEQVEEALAAHADVIMLDNMPLADVARAVALIGERATTEVSGNVDESMVSELAKTGVDIISSGAMTYNAERLDISMKISFD